MPRKNKKITPLGRFVIWADEIVISKRTALLVGLIFVFGFAVVQQSSGWRFFGPAKAAALENSDLPVFSPKESSLSGSGISCGNKQNGNIDNILGEYSLGQFAFRKKAEKIIQDKPMQEMIGEVAKRDISTASYLVAIAKKESNLGKFSPKDADGKNCYNYWGYRGSQNKTESGYSCFDSPEQAVAVVGDRIRVLSQIGKRETPKEMAVWKCGYDCSWDNQANVKKWIADVELYYDKLNL